ncbi:uncharacterized protein [Temnothorax nylanderi]|uniref:uncharacterized protein n=1 Tax=Temnothorax nylanderi TaxID=102681 RepID=UPI003A851195
MISPEKQFLLAIWRMATPDSYRPICEKFDVSRATALTTTRRVIKTLYNLAPAVIKWPSGNNVNEVSTGFKVSSGFPKVIGAIDGTHINIPAPRVQPASYVNRKGHYSIQLQAVCNHKAHFIHCFAGYPGSVHEKFPNDCHILGDAAYKLHQNVIVPCSDNGHLTPRQKNFNFCHSSARIAIERAFGLIKTRFRSIRTVLAMDRTDLIPMFIIACCVMHNICLSRGDEMDLEAIDEAGDNFVQDAAPPERTGITKRDLICETLPMRNI